MPALSKDKLAILLLTGCVSTSAELLEDATVPAKLESLPKEKLEQTTRLLGLPVSSETERLGALLSSLKSSSRFLASQKYGQAKSLSLAIMESDAATPILYRTAASIFFSATLLQHPRASEKDAKAAQAAFERIKNTKAWKSISDDLPAHNDPAQTAAYLLPTQLFSNLAVARPKNILAAPPTPIPAETKQAAAITFTELRALLAKGKLFDAAAAANAFRTPRADRSCDAEYAFGQYIKGQLFRATQRRPDALSAYWNFLVHADGEGCRATRFNLSEEEFFLLTSDARLWVSRLNWEQGKNRDAETFARAVVESATSKTRQPIAFEALQVLVGRIGFEDFEPEKNRKLIEGFGTTFEPTREQRDWISLRKSMFYLLEGRSTEGLTSLTPLLQSEDKTVQATALFWQGRLLATLNKPDEATAAYRAVGERDPLSYYDMRAGIELKATSRHASRSSAAFFDRPWQQVFQENLALDTTRAAKIFGGLTPSSPRLVERELVVALFATALARVELASKSYDEWISLWWRTPGLEKYLLTTVKQTYMKTIDPANNISVPERRALLQLAWVANMSGDFSTGILTAGKVRENFGENEMSKEEFESLHLLLYPRPFEREFFDAATKCHVDVNLLFALSRQESMFRSDARSPVGALGLMQLMPSTGRRLFKKLSLASKRIEQSLLLPELNTQAGACYLAELLERYNNNLPLAVAAYNAGETAVDNWKLKRYKNNDDALFIEFIPFQETQKYVQRVLRNYANMTWIYGEMDPLRSMNP